MSRGFLDEELPPASTDDDDTTQSNTVEVVGVVTVMRAKSIQIACGEKQPVWVPRSVIRGQQFNPANNLTRLTLPAWWAKQKNLI